MAELTPVLLCLEPRLFVLLITIKEDPATLRVLDIIHMNAYTLLNIWISDAVVDEEANRARSEVENDACSAVDALCI